MEWLVDISCASRKWRALPPSVVTGNMCLLAIVSCFYHESRSLLLWILGNNDTFCTVLFIHHPIYIYLCQYWRVLTVVVIHHAMFICVNINTFCTVLFIHHPIYIYLFLSMLTRFAQFWLSTILCIYICVCVSVLTRSAQFCLSTMLYISLCVNIDTFCTALFIHHYIYMYIYNNRVVTR